ncbi:Imm63 family immunity protein [Changchengzhania lutea]|uniref:Imm63 family immunity protein n=1 Tax=Changchengzhania lutea TaxID=2049305 RepID=UPI00115D4E8A|nr:Imm63 family immunity protein [Changchengzhania lutea]
MSQVQLLEKEFNRLSKKIAVPERLKPNFGPSDYDEKPYVFQDYKNYLHYSAKEKGQISFDKITTDFDEILYWIFDSITFSMAFHYELKNRIEEQDCRRIAFERQTYLMSLLNKIWEEKTIKKHNEILKEHPYDDLARLRASYCRKLRAKGLSEPEIDQKAYAKYPEP